MRPALLLVIGLIFLSAALIGLGLLVFQTVIPQERNSIISNIGLEVLHISSLSVKVDHPATATPSPIYISTPPPLSTSTRYSPVLISTIKPPSIPTPFPTDTPAPSPPATVTQAPPAGTAVSSPSNTPVPSPVPTLVAEAEWPRKMEVGQSDTIRVSLVRVTSHSYLPTIEIAGHKAVASTAIIVGTPSGNLEAAFGADYEASVTAHLVGQAFDVGLADPETQSLDQPRNDWTWNIISNKPGRQTVSVSIEVQWKPKGGAGSPEEWRIWHSDLEIEVFQQLITSGQLSIFTLLSGFIGSGLSVPWLYGVIKEKKPKTQQKLKAKSRRR